MKFSLSLISVMAACAVLTQTACSTGAKESDQKPVAATEKLKSPAEEMNKSAAPVATHKVLRRKISGQTFCGENIYQPMAPKVDMQIFKGKEGVIKFSSNASGAYNQSFDYDPGVAYMITAIADCGKDIKPIPTNEGADIPNFDMFLKK